MKKAKLFLIAIAFITAIAGQAQTSNVNANLPLLTELTQLQTKILSDIVEKKTALLEKHLHENVSLITFQGLKLDKPSFIGFVQNKDFVFESITPSDFQLGFSNANVAILTYKELVKMAGQPQVLSPIVTITYINEKGVWKAISVHAALIQG